MVMQKDRQSVSAVVRYNSRATRLCDELLRDIRGGRFQQGEYLPAEMSLAESYRVSRSTVRKAVDLLVQNKKLEKTPYRGVKVATESSVETTSAIPTASTPPRVTARAETKVKTTLAMVRSGTMDHATSEQCEGLREYGEQHAMDVRLYLSQEGHQPTLEMLSHIEHLADGVVVFPFDMPEYVEALNRLVRIGFPVVSIRPLSGVSMHVVNASESAGVYQAVKYLLQKYRRPVYYFGEVGNIVVAGRYDGYVQAMSDAGLSDCVERQTFSTGLTDVDPTIWGEEKSPMTALDGSRRLASALSGPASVYCHNDYAAASLYRACEERGLVVGKDVAIVGTDDLPLAEFLRPSLTTLHAFVKETGYEAARLLHRAIDGKVSKPVHVELPYKLIVRESA